MSAAPSSQSECFGPGGKANPTSNMTRLTATNGLLLFDRYTSMIIQLARPHFNGQQKIFTMVASSCGFTGNEDIYGLGIRIGIYAQTIAIWLGGDLIPQDTRDLATVNCIFMFAMVLTVIIGSWQTSLHAVEAFIILSILQVTHFTGPLLRHQSKVLFNKGLEGQFSNTVLELMMGCYANWFWWQGLDRLSSTPCGTFGFILFYRFNLYGPIRIVCKVFWILYMINKTPIFIRKISEVLVVGSLSRAETKDLEARLLEEAEAAMLEIYTNAEIEAQNDTKSNELPPPDTEDIDTASVVKPACTSDCQPESKNNEASLNGGPLCSAQELTAVCSTKSYTVLTKVSEADRFLSDIFEAYDANVARLSWIGFSIRGLPFYITPVGTLMSICFSAICAFGRYLLLQPSRLPLILITRNLFEVEPWLPCTHENTIMVKEVLQHPKVSDVSLEFLHLAAKARASRIPPAMPWFKVLRSAVIGGLLCATLILTIELTIMWNHITLEKSLNSVGQLVPFLIGCGSLLRVLYMELKHWCVFGCGTLSGYKRHALEKRPWAEAYQTWKAQHQEPTKVQSV